MRILRSDSRDRSWCPKCQYPHEYALFCRFDPDVPCRYCTRPVLMPSAGGWNVCPRCDVGPVPFDVYTGRKKPYNFWEGT